MAVNNIIDKWGLEFVTELKANLKNAGVTYAKGSEGRLAASIKYEIKYTAKGLTFELSMADEWYWTDKGRKAGNVSKGGQEKIGEWAARKGIVEPFRIDQLAKRRELQSKSNSGRKRKTLKKMPFDLAKKSLAFVISRSIRLHGYSKKTGYKGTKFYSSVIEKKKEQLTELLKEFYKKEIVIQFAEEK